MCVHYCTNNNNSCKQVRLEGTFVQERIVPFATRLRTSHGRPRLRTIQAGPLPHVTVCVRNVKEEVVPDVARMCVFAAPNARVLLQPHFEFLLKLRGAQTPNLKSRWDGTSWDRERRDK